MSGSFAEYVAIAAVLALSVAAAFAYAYYQLLGSYRKALEAAGRRTREYQLLTEIGQALHSHLDPDAVLQTIHRELGKLFEVESFYIAFAEGDRIRFEYQVIEGVLQPKHSRATTNAFTEHIIRTAQPLLITHDIGTVRARLGLVPTGKGARCYCGVPIFLGGRPAGVMAALSYEREFAYGERDVEVMKTAAGQVAVAIENARLFAQEQSRAHYLEFLNKVSKSAISTQDSELMLAEIMGEIDKNFSFDHIGIGVLDYSTNEIEIKAEVGTSERALFRRVPLGYGIIGQVARTNDTVLVQRVNHAEEPAKTILPDARSVLCVPVTYGDKLLGILNVESLREDAFLPQEVLTLRTLADLLATALHNVFVFHKMEQQSITDSLTGIKTRLYFLDALDKEWSRSSRHGHPFSVVLVDLDNFKQVNDSKGHLEGDLVLARVARVLEQRCRQSNVVARYGGDEFVILMPETTLKEGEVLAERLRLWLETDPMLNERGVSGSFGLACFPLHGTTAEEVLRVADAGMYVSKHAGGNRVSTAEQMVEAEDSVLRRQLLAAYVQGFVQREHTGPESVEELISTLKRLSSGLPESRELLMNAIDALTRAAETREVHAAGHGNFVRRQAEAVGRELGMGEEELLEMAYAAQIHDVGKIIIPEKILCKPGPLTDEEFSLVKSHSTVGGEIAETIPDGQNICRMVRHHHERFDGAGYPDQLAGQQIPMGARILALAGSWVSMTTERPFAPARDYEDALREVEANTGTQFDPEVASVFLKLLKTETARTQQEMAD